MVSLGTFSQLEREMEYFGRGNNWYLPPIQIHYFDFFSIFREDATPEQIREAVRDSFYGKLEKKFHRGRKTNDIVTKWDRALRASIVSTLYGKSGRLQDVADYLERSIPPMTRWTADEIKRKDYLFPEKVSDEQVIQAVNHVRTWEEMGKILVMDEGSVAQRVRRMIKKGKCPLVLEHVPRINSKSGSNENNAYSVLGPMSGLKKPKTYVLNKEVPETFKEMVGIYQESILEGGEMTTAKKKVLTRKLKHSNVSSELYQWYSSL